METDGRHLRRSIIPGRPVLPVSARHQDRKSRDIVNCMEILCADFCSLSRILWASANVSTVGLTGSCIVGIAKSLTDSVPGEVPPEFLRQLIQCERRSPGMFNPKPNRDPEIATKASDISQFCGHLGFAQTGFLYLLEEMCINSG